MKYMGSHFLDGRRFTDLATEKFILPAAKFNAAEQEFISSNGIFAPAETEMLKEPQDANNGATQGSNDKQDSSFINLVQWYMTRFIANQQPRIQALQQYYVGDNQIHYAPEKDSGKADNKIAATFPRYITNLKTGYFLGNPIQYKTNTENYPRFSDCLEDFNDKNSIDYHDKLVKKDLSICGRAFELLYIKAGTNDAKIARVDPLSAFCLYDSTIEEKRLCGVRFYEISTFNGDFYMVDVYTSKFVYHFEANSPNGGAFVLSKLVGLEQDALADGTKLPLGIEENRFNGVPLIEFNNNEERIGDWEFELDDIDAYDRAMSEMANSQENFTNAKLVITGEFNEANMVTGPATDEQTNNVEAAADGGDYGDIPTVKQDKPKPEDKKATNAYLTGSTAANNAPATNGKQHAFIIPKEKLGQPHPDINGKDQYLWLEPFHFTDPVTGTTSIVQPTANYLVKELNADGWKTYIDILASNILQMTGTPDTTDESFSSNSSGVALSYKLFGSDQDRKMQEALFSQAVLQRLQLLAEYWLLIEQSEGDNKPKSDNTTNDVAASVQLVYTPNLPKSDAEILAVISGVDNLNVVSDQTVLEMVAKLTGVDADQEQKRKDGEEKENQKKTAEAGYDPATFAQNVAQQQAQNGDDPRIQALAKAKALQDAQSGTPQPPAQPQTPQQGKRPQPPKPAEK